MAFSGTRRPLMPTDDLSVSPHRFRHSVPIAVREYMGYRQTHHRFSILATVASMQTMPPMTALPASYKCCLKNKIVRRDFPVSTATHTPAVVTALHSGTRYRRPAISMVKIMIRTDKCFNHMIGFMKICELVYIF